MLERLLATSKKWKNAQLIYADYFYVDAEGRITGKTKPRVLDYRHLLVGNPGNMAFLYTKKARETGGDYNTSLEGTEDWDMWLRMSEKWIFAYLPEPLYFFRQHKKSMTATMQPQIKAAETRTARAAMQRKKGSLDLMHLFPGLLDCRQDRLAMGLAHLQLGSLLLGAADHLGFLKLALGVLKVAVQALPVLPSAQLNYGAALIKTWLNNGRKQQARESIEAQIKFLESPAMMKYISKKAIYLSSLESVKSFLSGKNRTDAPLAIDKQTREEEMLEIPDGAISFNCIDPLFPFLIEASKPNISSMSDYHQVVGSGLGRCMAGCQGIRKRQGETMVQASRRCSRICKAPGPVKKGFCAMQQGPRPTEASRGDGLSPSSEAAKRVVWTGAVGISAKFADGDTESPTKISLRLTGSDLIDGGASAAEWTCKRHSLSPEVCETVKAAMLNASNTSRTPTGEDLDLEAIEAKTGEARLVTAASHHFFPFLKNLVGSVHFWESSLPVIIYDMGLTEEERKEIRRWKDVSLRTLDWSKQPQHVRDLYTYAWKPLVIQDALSRCEQGMLLYQDAGQEIRQPLDQLKEIIKNEGFLFPGAGVPASTTAHPSTLRALHTSEEELEKVPMALGGSMGLSCGEGESSTKTKEIIDAVVVCAKEEACISPPGATTSNHAFDQSVLSVHLHQANIVPSNDWRWMAHAEAFYSEPMSYRLPLANAPGSFKEVTPGDVVLYTRRGDGEGPYTDQIRRKC